MLETIISSLLHGAIIKSKTTGYFYPVILAMPVEESIIFISTNNAHIYTQTHTQILGQLIRIITFWLLSQMLPIFVSPSYPVIIMRLMAIDPYTMMRWIDIAYNIIDQMNERTIIGAPMSCLSHVIYTRLILYIPLRFVSIAIGAPKTAAETHTPLVLINKYNLLQNRLRPPLSADADYIVAIWIVFHPTSTVSISLGYII